MSKLTEKLRKVGQNELAPMGFGAFAARAKTPPMLLLVEVGPRDTAAAAKAVADGADAIFTGPAAANQVKALVAAVGETPVVAEADNATADDVKALQDAGTDSFLLGAVKAPAGALHIEGPGKFLVVDPAWPDTTLRAVEGLPLDGVVLRLNGAFTVESWIRCLRVGGLTRKPLLVAIDATVDSDTLRSLRDAGAGAVVVSANAVATARGLIDTLPAAKKPKDHRDVMLPAMARSAPPIHEEDDEE